MSELDEGDLVRTETVYDCVVTLRKMSGILRKAGNPQTGIVLEDVANTIEPFSAREDLIATNGLPSGEVERIHKLLDPFVPRAKHGTACNHASCNSRLAHRINDLIESGCIKPIG